MSVDSFAPIDPFADDPFANNSSEWGTDPASFYDKPPPARPLPSRGARSEINNTQALHPPTDSVDSSDLSGGTGAYEETEFLKNIQAQKRLEQIHEDSKQEYHAPSNQKDTIYQNTMGDDEDGNEYQVPPDADDDIAVPLTNIQEVDDPPESKPLGKYDYPSALMKYPMAKDDSSSVVGGAAISKDEPALHMLNYGSKLPPQAAAPLSGLTRHESLRNTKVSRHDMPLPPIPMEPQQGSPSRGRAQIDQAPPPLPARPSNMKHPSPLAGANTSSAPSNTQPVPKLPPLNHPWGNKKQGTGSTPSTERQQPPLPPRKKNGEREQSPGSCY